jgi:hypothetical protein
MNWDNEHFDKALLLAVAVAEAAKSSLVDFTKVFNDVAGAGATDAWMDAAVGMGHRIAHGHGLENVPEIFRRFGLEGIMDYCSHGLRDAMSPHGMPLPFAEEIASYLGMSTGEAINWLTVNVGDVLAGGLSLAHSWNFNKSMRLAVSARYMSKATLISALIGITIKSAVSFGQHNPIGIASALADLGSFAYGLSPMWTQDLGLSYFSAPGNAAVGATVTGLGAMAAKAAGEHVFGPETFASSTSGKVADYLATGLAGAFSFAAFKGATHLLGDAHQGFAVGIASYEFLRQGLKKLLPLLPEFLRQIILRLIGFLRDLQRRLRNGFQGAKAQLLLPPAAGFCAPELADSPGGG